MESERMSLEWSPGERLTPAEWLGCALIFAAVLLPLSVRQVTESRLRKLYRTETD